jgi:hypothetical protein
MRRHSLILLLLCGCGNSFTPASLVTGLRLLGAKAEPPEASAGDSVALTAWVVDTEMRQIAIAWNACLAPPVPGMGTINSDCLSTDMGTSLIPLGHGAMIAATVPAIPPNDLLPADITGGQYLPIRLGVTAAADDDSGVYRLRLRGNQPPNQNPTLSSIDVVTEKMGTVVSRQSLEANKPLAVKRSTSIILRAMFTTGSAETYQAPDDNGGMRTVTETLNVQWLATAGSLDNETSGADVDETFTLDDGVATGTVIDLWVVGHDERGGTDMMHRQLVAE